MTSMTDTATRITRTKRTNYVAGLRALADLLESTPDLPLPFENEFSWNVWPGLTTDDVKGEVARIRRLLPGTFTKNDPEGGDYQQKYFTLTSALHGLKLQIGTYRDAVCEQKVTGTREVTKTVPTATEEVTVIEDVVEWVCTPLLADAVSA